MPVHIYISQSSPINQCDYFYKAWGKIHLYLLSIKCATNTITFQQLKIFRVGQANIMAMTKNVSKFKQYFK